MNTSSSALVWSLDYDEGPYVLGTPLNESLSTSSWQLNMKRAFLWQLCFQQTLSYMIVPAAKCSSSQNKRAILQCTCCERERYDIGQPNQRFEKCTEFPWQANYWQYCQVQQVCVSIDCPVRISVIQQSWIWPALRSIMLCIYQQETKRRPG